MKRGRKKLYDFTGIDLSLPTETICAQTGYPAWAIRKERSAKGVRIGKGPQYHFTREELLHMTAGDVAKKHGCPVYAVTNARRLAGIKRRTDRSQESGQKITITIPLTITLTIDLGDICHED